MLENDDIRTVLVANGQAPEGAVSIQLCDDHYQKQVKLLEFYGQLDERRALQSFHILASLATRTLGTNTVVHYGCPVCALQKFDYLNELIPIILGIKAS